MPAAGWWPWFIGPVLEVCETDDLSLLCTLRRRWGPAKWRVADADGHRVGSVRRAELQDFFGHRVAVRTATADPKRFRFLTSHGRELGSLEHDASGTVVAFASDLSDDPLRKMLLLAAGLVADPLPSPPPPGERDVSDRR
jgi:hypothetical protein